MKVWARAAVSATALLAIGCVPTPAAQDPPASAAPAQPFAFARDAPDATAALIRIEGADGPVVLACGREDGRLRVGRPGTAAPVAAVLEADGAQFPGEAHAGGGFSMAFTAPLARALAEAPALQVGGVAAAAPADGALARFAEACAKAADLPPPSAAGASRAARG